MRRHLSQDIPYRVKWLNNPEVNQYIGDNLGQKTSLKKERQWFERYRVSKDKKFFTICDEKKPIGFMGLSNISKQNKNADLFIAIGEDDYRGKGNGKIALEWLLRYGFDTLGLHKISLGVIEDNTHAVKVYKSIGFVVEGKMKDEVYAHGRYFNMLSMAVFREGKK